MRNLQDEIILTKAAILEWQRRNPRDPRNCNYPIYNNKCKLTFLNEYKQHRISDPEYSSVVGAYYSCFNVFYYIEAIGDQYVATRSVDGNENKLFVTWEDIDPIEKRSFDFSYEFCVYLFFRLDAITLRFGL